MNFSTVRTAVSFNGNKFLNSSFFSLDALNGIVVGGFVTAEGYQTVRIKSGSPATRSSKDIHYHGEKAEMDEYALKEIVGHSIQDITESTYIVRDVDWLRKDLEKIK